jgi:5'(3')-deoxyribonucleotidase
LLVKRKSYPRSGVDGRMIYGLDVDNIVNTLTEAVLSVYNGDWDDNLTVNDITEYSIEKFVKPEAAEKFYEYFTDKRVWKRIKPINIEAVQWLIDHEDVYFVTATEPANLYKKQRWLGRLFHNIDLRKRLVRCYDKGLMDVDVLIDDSTKNLNAGRYLGVCIAYPWNEDWTGLRFNTVAEWIKCKYNVNI